MHLIFKLSSVKRHKLLLEILQFSLLEGLKASYMYM